MSQRRNLKASEVWAGRSPFIGRKASFCEAFPEIDDIQVEVTQTEDALLGLDGGAVYHMGEFGEFIDCRNSYCYNGGVCIGEVIRDMYQKRNKEHTEERRCQGYEGSPKGRKFYHYCRNDFTIKITIKYKDAPAEGEAGNS